MARLEGRALDRAVAEAMDLEILEGMLVEDDGQPSGAGNLFPIPSYSTDYSVLPELRAWWTQLEGRNILVVVVQGEVTVTLFIGYKFVYQAQAPEEPEALSRAIVAAAGGG